jgi:AhpD family alkylhydroperoxidase
MRITPIESPRNPLLRLAYRLCRRQLGRAIAPFTVVFARIPRALVAHLLIHRAVEKGLTLDPALKLLLEMDVARVNGCGACLDIGRALAVYRGAALEKFDVLADWPRSPLFDARERAALAYVEEATRERRVADATFEALRPHFSEREIVEMTWLCAVENYYNMINIPLGIESDGLCAIAEARTGRRSGSPATAARRAS